MLIFKSDDEYFNKITELEKEAENEEQDFINRHPNASELEINYYDSIENFDEYRVYKNFAQSLNFDALIYDFINLKQLWMESDLNENLNPYIKFYGLDEAELSILNKDYAYMIENDDVRFIIKHFSDGIAVITDGNLNTLNHLSSFNSLHDSDVELLENVQYSFNSSSNCISWGTQIDYRSLNRNSTKRVYGITRITRYYEVWGYIVSLTKLKVKAVTIKKRWWCNCWRRYRVSHIKAAIDGRVGEWYCGDYNIFLDKSNNYKEKTNRSKVVYKFYYPPPQPDVLSDSIIY